MGLVLGLVRLLGVHGLNLEQREEPFLVLGRADLARDQLPVCKSNRRIWEGET